MTDDEVDELLKVVDTSSGEINYTGLSSLLPSSLICYLSRALANFGCIGQTSFGPFSQTDRFLYTLLPSLRPT